MHWGTFPALTGTPAQLREELRKRNLATEVIALEPGGVLAAVAPYWSGSRPANPSSYPWKYSRARSGYFQQ